MSVHRRYDVWALIAIVAAITAYASFSVEFRLRSTMPREFFDPSTVPSKQRATESALAKAYWQCAVTQIQWKYGYAHRLPDEPVAEFVIASGPFTKTDAANSRLLYWQRLRQTYELSSSWERRYEWNTISLRASLQSAGAWLEKHMRNIIGYS
jgi:hypothetical protein